MSDHLQPLRPVRFFLVPAAVLLGALYIPGCRPDLPTAESLPFTPIEPPELVVTIEPEAPLDAAPRVLRVRLQWPELIDPRRVFLVRGEVSDHHLRQIERDDISKTLAERFVPTVVWAEDERTVVVAPTVVLEPGQTYAVASGEPRKAVSFVVAAEAQLPLFRRMWPPVDQAGAGLGIFCGPVQVPEIQLEVRLEPTGPLGTLSRGLAPQGPGQDCVRFEVHEFPEAMPSGPFVLPPVIEFPGFGAVQLEPMRFQETKVSMEEILPLECLRDEVPFGPGCAWVLDDRLLVRAPEGDLLWGIEGAGMQVVRTTAKNDRLVLKGLPAESEIVLDVVTIDAVGRTRRETFTATTLPLSPHVILNEVLANPVGPEPAQEWVELYNDGQVETTLAGYRILDIGGDTALPDVVLPPGRFALVVNETFFEDDEVDVVPAKGTILVRVPALGKSGLSNAGELIRLVDPSGRIISRFPALPKPKAGRSVSRQTPSSPDGVSSSFAISDPTPGMPNEVAVVP